MPSDLTKKVVVGCLVVGAAAVAGAALYFRVLRREEAEEDLHFTIPPKVEKPANNAEKPEAKPTATGDAFLDALADELVKVAKGEGEPVVDSEDGYETFSEIGLKCKAPEGWELQSEDGPTPQIAVVKLYPKGLTEEQRMDPSAFGTHPNIMVMVEDTVEPMSAKEYKDKSKEMAIKSGQGMMQIISDEQVKVGPFDFQLEGAQPIPDPMQGRLMQIKFLNLLTMRGSCGYAVQYISTDDNFAKHLDFVLEWASTIKLFDLTPRAKSALRFTSAAQQVQMDVPWQWSLGRRKTEGRDAIVTFKAGGSNPDLVTVFKAKKDFASAKEHLEEHLQVVGASGVEVATEGDVAQCRYTADGKELALLCSAQYAVEARPEGRKSTLPEAVLRDVLGAIQPGQAEKDTTRYINNHHRFSYETTSDCSLAEFKFGTTAVMYSPVPQPQDDAEANIPIFKVFVNKEQEHYEDLKAVEAKLREACDPSTPMRDCQVEKVGDREWLTFTTSFMDGPYGPFGPREEFKSKVFICLRGNESFMLKWEIAANEWRRYERHLRQLMDSFVVQP